MTRNYGRRRRQTGSPTLAATASRSKENFTERFESPGLSAEPFFCATM